eukprot:MONOS_15815.1-p1 / transcript=MONOS_15815.1 / gene=MONOS_15815 / organism=Monocercomonoides_exilis_PA203 / gene_product=unspecified product / transcript_product=unspecified product / location=Mono_scaffold01363:1575-2246(-) / protein_length=224 / sequence_SO=supercontig / SO=protein_coding / is_pseudo=false
MQFLMFRIFYERSLEEVFMNELHFVREARRELEELTRCVDWKRKEGENEIRGKDTKEVMELRKCIETVGVFLYEYRLRTEEYAVLIGCIIQILQAAKDNHREVEGRCTELLKHASRNAAVEIDDLLESGAAHMALGETIRFDLLKSPVEDYLLFFENICKRLKENKEKENEETKRKETKRKVFDRLEEEGYEDGIIRLRYCILKGIFGDDFLVRRIEYYIVHC